MPLREFWASSPEAVMKMGVQQVLMAAGNGNLRDGNECSIEFRDFLRQVSSAKLSEYVKSCLEQSFKDSGLVLQDLINEMGRRLGFSVEDGLYRGKPSAIGFDGIWRSEIGEDIVIEVKTTDYVTVSLDKIAHYRKRLVENGKIGPESSVLIVVGREDTGALEAQIRGSRYAWEMRLIGADRLDYLLQIKEKSNDNNTVRQIQELLRPFEYTKVDKIIDVMFSAARDVEPAEVSSLLSGPDVGDNSESFADEERVPGKQIRTDFGELTHKRVDAIRGLGRKLGITFLQHRQTLFWSSSHEVRACAAVSKRYGSEYKPYWYAYHPHWDEFLREGNESYFVLACMDRETGYAIPHDQIGPNLDDCSQTVRDGKIYWHITLRINQAGKVMWDFTKTQRQIDLTKYEFPLVRGNDSTL